MYVSISVFILFFLSETLTLTSIKHTMNVGTVLFSPSDLRKSHWSSNEIELLRTRRHFQGLLPLPNSIDTTKEYVNTLLKYFKDTYSTIKKEASCPIAENLMSTAFSDAVGGYLKMWILPISKLSFYGGILSQEQIMKLIKYYDEIKRFLETDGKDWRSPDKTFLKAITVSVTPPKHVTRSKEYPCEKLSYYERTENGLSIPTPYINWNQATMFVPLRDQSVIPLNSPNHTNILLKYYETAKNCLDESSSELYDFNERLQDWLDKDVVSHLSDEQVYLPLGSVLSLMNNSVDTSDRLMQLYDPTFKSHTNTHFVIAGVPIDLKSKKIWIVAILLTLEIVWCIPTLLCLICSKRKRLESTNIYTLLGSSKYTSNTYDDDDDTRNDRNNNIDCECNKCFSKDVRRKHKSRTRFKVNRFSSGNLDLKTQFLPQDPITSITTDTSSVCSTVSILHEVIAPAVKSSPKKTRSSHAVPSQQSVTDLPLKSDKIPNKLQKLYHRLRIDPSSRVQRGIYNKEDETESSRLKKQILEPLQNVSNATYVFSTCNLDKKISADNKPCTEEKVPECSCLDCSKSSQKCCTEHNTACCPCPQCFDGEIRNEVTVKHQATQPNEKYSNKNVETDLEFLSPRADKSTNVKNRKSLESGRPYLDIKIHPGTEVSVGIAGNFDAFGTHRKSKIPKRLPKTAEMNKQQTVYQMTRSTSPVKKKTTQIKSMIPQPKKRSLHAGKSKDDIVLKSSKAKWKYKNNKLNVTL